MQSVTRSSYSSIGRRLQTFGPLLVVLALIAGVFALSSQVGARAPFVGVASMSTGSGYWAVDSNGLVDSFDGATWHGDLEGVPLNQPIVDIDANNWDGGYWLASTDGGVFTFGDAAYVGSMGGFALNQPVVGIASTPSGAGYWLVAADGGVFAFGDAAFYGSMGGSPLNDRVVGITATPSGHGYWMATADGGVFSFGDAMFYGSMGGITLNQPVVGITATPSGAGYWLAAKDGGVFSFGDANFNGAGHGTALGTVIAIDHTPAGYLLLDSGLTAFHFAVGSPPQATSATPTGPDRAPEPTPSSPDPSQVQGDNPTLVFADEFNGASLDGSKWDTCYPWALTGCTNVANGEAQWYEPGQVRVSDGQLHLVAEPGGQNGYAYKSGMVTSSGQFDFTYGYVEMRATVPFDAGIWPALWLLPSDGSWPPEIDMMEAFGARDGRVAQTYHLAQGGSVARWSQLDTTTPHTFGLLWEPNLLVFYIDGAEVYRTTEGVTAQPMYVLANLAVNGNGVAHWGQLVDGSTQFPATFSLDYVRIWQ